MALGDILAGLSEAGHAHRTTLLQMDYEKKKDLADKYFQISQNPDYPSEMRAESLKRTIGLHTLEPEKKLPKEWESMTFQVTPPTPAPMSVPGSEGTNAQSVEAGGESIPQSATAAINPRTIQPPTPPPYQQQMRPKTFGEHLQEAHDTATMAADVKTQTELKDISQRYDFLKNKFGKDLPEPAIAAMATGHAPPSLSFAVPGTMDENQVLQTTGQQVPSGHYNVRMMNGSWLATPVEAKVSGGVKFAVDPKTNKPVAYTTDQYGKVTIEPNVDLTPIQMLPTTVTSSMPRIVQQPDGSLVLQTVPSTSTRVRGAVEAPVAPPSIQDGGSGAKSPKISPTISTGPIAAPPTAPTANGRVVGGKSFTPEQVKSNTETAAAFDNMIDRLSGTLANADKFQSLASRAKIRFATDPLHEGRVTIAGAVGLTPEESDFAADYLSLGEDINLLRSVFKVVSRGAESFSTQQAQRGLITGDFGLFKKTMRNTLKASVDQMSALNKSMTTHGQPLPVTDGVLRAYLQLNNNDENKAEAALKRDGWQVQ